MKVSSFFQRVSSPVDRRSRSRLRPLLTEYTYPRKLTDLFRGMQLTIIGRYKNTNDLKDITLRMTGKVGSVTRHFDYSDLDFPVSSDDNDFLPRLWASRRVGWLLEQIRSNGETKETRDEVVELGTRYGLVTPYTSYLATDGSMANVRRDAPMAADMMVSGMKKAAAKSGAGAVTLSTQQNEMKMNTRAVASEDKDEKQQIVLRNTVSNQLSRTKISPTKTASGSTRIIPKPLACLRCRSNLRAMSTLPLVSSEPALAPYLSLGEQVVVVWNGKVYRITK
jgi:hypothetical protein